MPPVLVIRHAGSVLHWMSHGTETSEETLARWRLEGVAAVESERLRLSRVAT